MQPPGTLVAFQSARLNHIRMITPWSAGGREKVLKVMHHDLAPHRTPAILVTLFSLFIRTRTQWVARREAVALWRIE